MNFFDKVSDEKMFEIYKDIIDSKQVVLDPYHWIIM